MARFLISRVYLTFICAASVEEHAFHRMPELGPAPDMINDDLPTNLDYLDDSFGTAAGLRELRDDDLDDFDREDLADFGPVPGSVPLQSNVISSVGGETIRMIAPQGIHIVEHYFNTLPAVSEAATKE